MHTRTLWIFFAWQSERRTRAHVRVASASERWTATIRELWGCVSTAAALRLIRWPCRYCRLARRARDACLRNWLFWQFFSTLSSDGSCLLLHFPQCVICCWHLHDKYEEELLFASSNQSIDYLWYANLIKLVQFTQYNYNFYYWYCIIFITPVPVCYHYTFAYNSYNIIKLIQENKWIRSSDLIGKNLNSKKFDNSKQLMLFLYYFKFNFLLVIFRDARRRVSKSIRPSYNSLI